MTTSRDHILDPDDLVEAGIRTVIVASPDLTGRLVGRRVPVEGFPRVVEKGVDVCTCVYAWDVDQSFDVIGNNLLPLCGMHNGVPDVTFRPDLTTLRRAAWLDGVAVCLADPYEHHTDELLPISPRTILRSEVGAYDRLGLQPWTGTELEFFLFKNDPRELRMNGFRGLEPTTLYPSDFMIHEGNVYEPFFQKLRSDLRESGILMEAAQSEWGTGQWEMTFVYTDPLEMADRHALYKLAVRDVAAMNGMSVTFMARPFTDQAGSSCHVHLSMTDGDGQPAFWDEDGPHHMSRTMNAAIAGVLEHAPEVMIWYAPTINSYRRSNATDDVAGWGRTWGVDNRTASVRVVGESPSDLRMELRLPGADTNPYLTLTGLLASARDGIERGLQAPPETTGNAYLEPHDPDMPRLLHEATALWAASDFTRQQWGQEIVDHFRVMAEHESRVFHATVSDWDLHRYFDRI
jgi:glutamine synthetase